MQLKLLRQLWGVQDPLEQAVERFASLGYSGIEAGIFAKEELERLRRSLESCEMRLVPMAFTGGGNAAEHLESLERTIHFVESASPWFINSHSGEDAWGLDEAKRFFEGALKLEAKLGLPISHETHRSRVFYNPWATRDILRTFPELKLTCDYSHWVCVTESLLGSEAEVLELCARHAHHIHARVGYEHGPQVPDPRAPEWQCCVEAHERWWDAIWEAQRARGVEVTTLTPEFGPPDYLHTQPFTRKPVADLAEICEWQATRQRQRFDARFG